MEDWIGSFINFIFDKINKIFPRINLPKIDFSKWTNEIFAFIREEMPPIIYRTIVLIISVILASFFKTDINFYELFLSFISLKYHSFIPLLMGSLAILFLIFGKKISGKAKGLIEAVIAFLVSISVVYFLSLISFIIFGVFNVEDVGYELYFMVISGLYVALYLQLGMLNLLKFLLHERGERNKAAEKLRKELKEITVIRFKELWHNLKTIGYSKTKDD
ncbi:hypothetical protein LNQ82_07435 [Conchiformibius steedae DSM 2580]|uniref:Uncharacterized protein n=1 Tax=Conchiformibius steedae DSM 2580 TaxID=1121352 RepID=A0AAE9KZH1_9NEIS|nr:hypothetical protein [Conchiformibius steedae]QMT34256.1 hypothetical protein H3L98_04525 [Conchiformibius steedae]URD67029.1 hypothetical protein LNQ82_07435 [Conchiformibius steedae DSM 2580]